MYKNFGYLLLGATGISLTGCVTAPSELRNAGPDHRATVVLQQNYQPVYRAILQRQCTCEQQNLITAQFIVPGDLFTDTRSGTITTALHGGLGVQTQTVVDIKEITDSSTEVVISTSLNAAKYSALVQKWLGGAETCS